MRYPCAQNGHALLARWLFYRAGHTLHPAKQSCWQKLAASVALPLTQMDGQMQGKSSKASPLHGQA